MRIWTKLWKTATYCTVKSDLDISRVHCRCFYMWKACDRDADSQGRNRFHVLEPSSCRELKVLRCGLAASSVPRYLRPTLPYTVYPDYGVMCEPTPWLLRSPLTSASETAGRQSFVVSTTARLEPLSSTTRENPFPDLKVFARGNSFPLVSWVA